MRNILIIIVLCLIAAPLAAQIEDPKASFRALRALDGVWFLPSDRGDRLEVWKIENDSTMSARVMRIKEENGDTITLETLRLTRRDTNIVYAATVKSQNQGKPVEFRLTQDDEEGFLFENPKHDNPQKIRYQVVSNREMVVTVEGKRNGRAVSEEMVYEREFNPASVEFRVRAGVGVGALQKERNLNGMVSGPDFGLRPAWDLGAAMAFKGSGGFLTVNVEASLSGRPSGVQSEFYDDTVRFVRAGNYRMLWGQLAVYPEFTLRREGRLAVIVGPYAGRLLYLNATGNSLPEAGRDAAFESKNDLKKTDFGFLAGLHYRLKTARPVTIGARYHYGLRDLDNLYNRRCINPALCNERVVLRTVSVYATVKL
jgi:hypothetical protein